MYELQLTTDKGITYLTSPELQEKSIFVAFTTKHTGFSATPYDSLNLAFHVGDNSKQVLKNRRHVAELFDFDIGRLTCAQQVHGATARFIDAKDAGKGVYGYETAIKDTDGLATDIGGVTLGMFFADCLPVVLVSPEPRVVAIAHAGHKGLFSGVIEQLIKKVSEKTEPKRMLAFLGPAIGPCCYEVDESRINQFSQKFPRAVKKTDTSLDLKKIAASVLLREGLASENIYKSSFCTCCNNDLFFSYRRNSTTGRQAAIAFIKG